MKSIVFLAIVALFAACNKAQPRSYYTTVMIDLTEKDGYKPTAEIIKHHAILPDRESGMYFSILPINDLAHNTHNGVFITRADVGVTYDEMSRKIVVDDYHNKIDSLLLELKNLEFGTDYSQIFRAVATESRFLMKQDCDQKKIVLYSDLEENSSFFSLQNRAHRKMMDDPKSLQQFFEDQYNLEENESFEGLNIEIHHIPDYMHEPSFDVFFKLYSDIFESRGAKVTHEKSIITHVEL